MITKFKLRRGHKEIFGEDSLLGHREAAERIEEYMYHNKLMIELRYPPYDKMTPEKVEEINKRREDLIGEYIDIIDPNFIINMPWTKKGKLPKPRRYDDPNFKDITMASIKKWGIFVPIIVAALPEWHSYWNRPTKIFKTYDPRCTIILEGRHRTYTAITTGIKQMMAFVLDPIRVEE